MSDPECGLLQPPPGGAQPGAGECCPPSAEDSWREKGEEEEEEGESSGRREGEQSKMAASSSSTIPCRYFMNGMCREGSSCRYSHSNSPGGQPLPRSNMPCKFFARGNCMYGDRCRFSHTENRNTSVTTSNGPASSSSNSSLSRGHSPSLRPTVVLQSKREDKNPEPSFTTFRKKDKEENATKDISTTLSKHMEEWVNAPEFVPSYIAVPKSYAAAVNPEAGKAPSVEGDSVELLEGELCPFAMVGECKFGLDCPYIHGEVCELCGHACMHPLDEALRKQHTEECLKQHEKDMELSFAVARSKDKSCGICMEVIMEKHPPSLQRFGILPKCTHCFCLPCIRKWRQAKQFENKIIRACPECRVLSDYVCPSRFWVETKEEKDKLLEEYKVALSQKACKYFKQGRGECPFGNKCFYLHALPDGTKTDVGPPQRQRRHNASGEVDVVQSITLWEFLEEWESRWVSATDVEDVLLDFFFDSDESDWSEYEDLED